MVGREEKRKKAKQGKEGRKVGENKSEEDKGEKHTS